MYSNIDISDFRILPMDSIHEFQLMDFKEVQDKFFFGTLQNRNGVYYYLRNGLEAKRNSLILFQYDNNIIASGIFLKRIKKTNQLHRARKGILVFKKDSIGVFDRINSDELNEIGLRNLKGDRIEFSNVKHKLAVNGREKNNLFELLKRKNIKFFNSNTEDDFNEKVESLNLENYKKDNIINDESEEKSKIWIAKRDPYISKKVIVENNYLCEVSSSHNYFISRVTQKNYVEAHHLIPIEFQESFDKPLDVESNIISVCPMCHKKFHHGILEDIKDDLISLFKKKEKSLEENDLYITEKELLLLYDK